MKKIIVFFTIPILLVSIGGYVLLSNSTNTDNKDNKYSTNSSIDSHDYNPSNNHNSNKNLEEKDNLDIVSVSIDNNSSYLVDVSDYEDIKVSLSKNSSDTQSTEKYVNVDYENLKPIIENIDTSKNYTLFEYIDIYDKVKPYIDTNLSSTDIFKIVSSVDNIHDINFETLLKKVRIP